MSDAERDEALFTSLLAMLSQQAMMALGKIVPPGAEEPMLDLEVARTLIDTLEVLQKKTEGQRTENESKFLELQLTNLRLNFLETQKEQEKAADGEE
jgi:hypothetical protein